MGRLTAVRGLFRGVAFARERAALALLMLGFFVYGFTVLTLLLPPEVKPMFTGLTLCYLTAFLALAAQWFWGRWFASGLAWSGFGLGLASMVQPQIGPHPVAIAFTVMHAVVIAALMGSKMAARYELQPGWRERFAIDEYGVTRLGKAVTRGSASLPTLIAWALASRTGQGIDIVAGVAFIVGALGVAGMLRLRTWGALALGLAAMVVAGAWMFLPGPQALAVSDVGLEGLWSTLASPGVTIGIIAFALAPRARPAWRFLCGDARAQV